MIGDTQSRLFIRMQKIARLRCGSIPDARIAQLVGMTPMGFARIVALPEYKLLEQEVLKNTVSLMDQALAENADALRANFKVGVPMAMRALLDSVRQSRDLRSRLDAARELLDRDPDRTFVKAADAQAVFHGGATIPASIFKEATNSAAEFISRNSIGNNESRDAAEVLVPKALDTASLSDDDGEATS
jgi:hypothetical protein